MYGHKLRPANSGAVCGLDFIAVHTAVHHFVRASRSHCTMHDVEFTVFAECSDNYEATDVICAPWSTQIVDKRQICRSRCSVVSIVTRLQAGGPAFESEQEQDVFSLSQNIHTGRGAQPSSYSFVTGVFPGSKAVRA